MNAAAREFLAHLFHKRCSRCYGEGWAIGYHRAAVESERRERLLRAGYSWEQVERWDQDRIRQVAR